MDLRENKGLSPVESGFPITSITIDLTKRCNLACDYCNPAGTPILMADLTYKKIEDVQVGDRIIGFVKPEEKGKHTYFVESIVEAKMERDADLVEVYTDHGTFKCTPDHKWFNGRSYVPAKVGGKIKYVSDPVFFNETDEYKIGYIHGVMAGDGCFSDGIHEVKSGSRIGQLKKYKHVRLVLNDTEPLDRIEKYIADLGWPAMNRFQFNDKMTGLRSSNVELYDKLIGIPDEHSTTDYLKGWVAGIFDAEGSYDGNSLRISQKYEDVLYGIQRALVYLGFHVTYSWHGNDVCEARIGGGYSEVVKFFAMCNPAISRKKENVLINKGIYGESKIIDIKPAGSGKVYSMQTSTHNYIAHGHTSRNCFAHCFNQEREKADLTLEMGKRIIDWVMRKDVHGDSETVDISFWGGEPLLKFDLLKELILYAEEKAKEAGVKVGFGGTTNVTLLTPEKFDFLEEHNCYFLLSIDGTKEHHDLHRKFVGGRGSWEVIDKNMDAIIKRWPNMKGRISYSVETIDGFLDDIKYLYSKGIRDIAYSPVSEGDWNEERLATLKKVWDDVADWYIERYKAGDPVQLKFVDDSCAQYLGYVMGKSAPCGAGRGYIGITIDGSIYPCHRFNKMDDKRPWYEREVCLGHIDYGILNQEWRDRFIKWDTNKDLPERCSTCPAKGVSCTGGCWATNWDLAGDLSGAVEPGCTTAIIALDNAKKVCDALGPQFTHRFHMKSRGENNLSCVCYNVCDRHGTPMERQVINKSDPMSCLCYFAKYDGEPAENIVKNEDPEIAELKRQIAEEQAVIEEYFRKQEAAMLQSQLEELREIRKAIESGNNTQ